MPKNTQKDHGAHVFEFFLNKNSFGIPDLLRPHALYLVFGCCLLLITNLIFVLLPTLINAGVTLIESGKSFDLSLPLFSFRILSVRTLIGGILGLVLFGAIIRTLSRMVVFDVGRTIERDVRAQIFFHASVLDDSFYQTNSVGSLMNHMTTDLNNIRMVTGFAVLNIMNIVFIFILTVPMLIKIDFGLAICGLLPFPMVMLATQRLSKKMYAATKSYQEKLGDFINQTQENLLGAHVVRLFHQQERESKRFFLTNQNTFAAGVTLAKVRVAMFPVMRLVMGLSFALILFVGGQAVAEGRITVGEFVEVNARVMQLAWPAMSIGFVMSIFALGQASIVRINELLQLKPQIIDGNENLGKLNKIDVVNLIVNRDRNAPDDGISFSLRPGEMLGVVGESGSYKSTLLKSLYRRNVVEDGTVFFNEHDVNNLTLSSIYQQISVVSQEPFLFHQSIKDNICFATPSATLSEVQDVIKLVKLESDIAGFKDGVETIIGERGITLSGGQRQRVALARALLQKHPLLILDDALSAVDAETEDHIIEHLHKSLGDTMVIIATHRLSALKRANKILVLKNGSIKEQGTHNELMKPGSIYQELWGFNEAT